MREYVRRTIAELDQEIADLTAARDALLRLNTTAKPAAARKPRAKTPPKEKGSADADAVSDTGARILKFLDKSGPAEAPAIVAAIKGHPPGTMNSLKKLVRLGLAEDNHGRFRCTDKGFDAALS